MKLMGFVDAEIQIHDLDLIPREVTELLAVANQHNIFVKLYDVTKERDGYYTKEEYEKVFDAVL